MRAELRPINTRIIQDKKFVLLFTFSLLAICANMRNLGEAALDAGSLKHDNMGISEQFSAKADIICVRSAASNFLNARLIL